MAPPKFERARRVAGGEETNVRFAPEAIAEIHAATDGVPRLINVLCDNALLVGYAQGKHCNDSGVIMEVVRDMTWWGLRTPQPAPAGK